MLLKSPAECALDLSKLQIGYIVNFKIQRVTEACSIDRKFLSLRHIIDD